MSEAPLADDPRPAKLRRAPSLVIVNTGGGKGKSTAAMGILMRAVARSWKVAVVQFIKSGEWKVGEEKTSRLLGVDWDSVGDGFSWDSGNLEASAELAREAWDLAKRRIEGGEHHLVILDEITYPMNWGWIDTAQVVETISNRPKHVNVVATGRDACPELVEVADTVTEMTEVKHAYQSGFAAKKGIDF